MIIHIVAHCSLPVGTYFRSHNLAVGLSRLGNEVRVFTTDHSNGAASREEMRDGVAYRIVRSSKGKRFFGLNSHPLDTVVRAASDYPRADISHLFQPFLSGLLLWKRQTTNSATVGWYDWDDLWTDGGLLDRGVSPSNFSRKWSYYWTSKIERELPSRASKISTCSSWLSSLAAKRGAKNPLLLRNGFWPGSSASREVARHELGLHGEASYLGFMGRTLTGDELNWCIEGLDQLFTSFPSLRLAVCGIDSTSIHVPSRLEDRVDLLGVIDPVRAQLFASAMDIGLVPLEDCAFNWSRFPIRFAHFLAAGTPVVCSEIGELQSFAGFQGVLPAGRGREAWLAAFRSSVERLNAGQIPPVIKESAEQVFSWGAISKELQDAYLRSL